MGKTALNPITYVTGTLGSGKSYYAMRKVFEYLHAGKTVATNFDLIGDWAGTICRRGVTRRFRWDGSDRYRERQSLYSRAWRYNEPDDLYGFELPGDLDQEDRGLLVLDEGALRLNKRVNRERLKLAEERHGDKLKELEFYVNMRKIGWTTLIIAHSVGMLDDQIESLGGGVVRLRNFARVKMPVVGIPMSKNPRFLAIHYWPEVRAITGREFYGLDLSIARHYRSMERFTSGEKVYGLRRHVEPGPLGRPLASFAELDARREDRTDRPQRSEDGPPASSPPAALSPSGDEAA